MATPIILEKEDSSNATTHFLNLCSIFILYLLIHRYVLQDIFQYFQDNTTIKYFNIMSRIISVFLFTLVMFAGYSISKGHVHSDADTMKIGAYFFTLIIGVFSILGLNVLLNKNKQFFYALLIGIGIAILSFTFFTNKNEKIQQVIRLAGFVLITLAIFGSIGYGIYNSYQNYPTYTILSISLAMLLGILYALYYGVSHINLSYFFIKIQNGINELINDYQRTSNSSKLFIVVQIAILVLYFTYHLLINSITKANYPKGKYLLNKNSPLNESQIVASYNDLKPHFNTNKSSGKQSKYDYSYSMSMWFQINSESNIDSFINIFNYGKNPTIEYSPSNNRLRILVRANNNPTANANGANTSHKQIYITNDLLYQRWNHIVMNYHNAQLDIFINNKLVHSEENILPYMEEDSILVGSNNNVNGNIKNIVYFKKPLSLGAIQKLYYESENTLNKPLLMNPGILQTLIGKVESAHKSFDETIQEKIN